MREATIWYLVTNGDGMVRFYFFPTKNAAERAFREREVPEDTDEIVPVRFPVSGKGLAEALNWLIDMTCHNEG